MLGPGHNNFSNEALARQLKLIVGANAAHRAVTFNNSPLKNSNGGGQF
jgi:hypothetical protein